MLLGDSQTDTQYYVLPVSFSKRLVCITPKNLFLSAADKVALKIGHHFRVRHLFHALKGWYGLCTLRTVWVGRGKQWVMLLHRKKRKTTNKCLNLLVTLRVGGP